MKAAVLYCPQTGVFTRGGVVVGCQRSDGYLVLWHEGRIWRAHRLAWTLAYGPIPPHLVVDHINQDRGDNRLTNLRLATKAENGLNGRRRRDYVYVYKRKDAYRIKLWTPTGQRHMGTFHTRTAAEQRAEEIRTHVRGGYDV